MLNGRTAPPSGESSLDARLCADLGAELARVRQTRGLTVAQVGEKLLLSTRQVKALEAVDFTAFHNAAFHLGALRKYAAFADLNTPLLEKIAASLVMPDPHAIMLVPSESSDEAGESSSGRLLSTFGTLIAVAVLAAGGYYLAQNRSGQRPPASTVSPATPTPAPAPVVPAPVPAPAPAVVEPAAVPAPDAAVPALASQAPPSVTVADAQGFGVLRVLHPTWIFVRDVDNTVIERSLAQGETFVLESQPTYLAVGTADAELSIGTRRVDVAKFVSSGQIRIRAGDFDALVQGASPIQAPTPAARP